MLILRSVQMIAWKHRKCQVDDRAAFGISGGGPAAPTSIRPLVYWSSSAAAVDRASARMNGAAAPGALTVRASRISLGPIFRP